jgi:glycerate kinase
MEFAGFSDAVSGVDLVVTGEGSFDEQSVTGKITGAVISQAQNRGIPVAVVCGVSQPTSITNSLQVVEISRWASHQAESIAHTEELLVRAGPHRGNSLAAG